MEEREGKNEERMEEERREKRERKDEQRGERVQRNGGKTSTVNINNLHTTTAWRKKGKYIIGSYNYV